MYHEATGHYENKWVQDSAAWDEPTYEERYVCYKCGKVMTADMDPGVHVAECGGSYGVESIQTGTIHHEATGHNEQKWVQDSAAWTETVTTGYKCSGCGATK